MTLGDLAHALGWHAIPIPHALVDAASLGATLPLMPSLSQWVNAGRVPVVMDTARARRELRWRRSTRPARRWRPWRPRRGSRGWCTSNDQLAFDQVIEAAG